MVPCPVYPVRSRASMISESPQPYEFAYAPCRVALRSVACTSVREPLSDQWKPLPKLCRPGRAASPQITGWSRSRRVVQVCSKANRNALGCDLHRIPCKVGVAGGRLDVCDDQGAYRSSAGFHPGRGPSTRRSGVGRECVRPRAPPSCAQLPRCPVHVGQTSAGSAPENHTRIVGLPGQSGQDLSRLRLQRNRACARSRRPAALPPALQRKQSTTSFDHSGAVADNG